MTPPFPGYVSGHSTVSGASAKMLELFTDSDYFGETENRIGGALTEPGFPCNVIQQQGGQPLSPADLSCTVSLPLPTFTATAKLAGISRVMGGYHIQVDNIEGLALGRRVTMYQWPRIQAYFEGEVHEGDG